MESAGLFPSTYSKHVNSPSVHQQNKHKTCTIHTMDYYSAQRMKSLFTATWMEPEMIILVKFARQIISIT